jgi:hypothetical protein
MFSTISFSHSSQSIPHNILLHAILSLSLFLFLTHSPSLFLPITPPLSALSKEIEELNDQFREANSELDILQSEASLMFKRLAAASTLIEGTILDRTWPYIAVILC